MIGLIEPLKSAFFSDKAPLRFISSVAETLGKPTVTLSAILMAVSLGTFFDKLQKVRHRELTFLFLFYPPGMSRPALARRHRALIKKGTPPPPTHTHKRALWRQAKRTAKQARDLESALSNADCQPGTSAAECGSYSDEDADEGTGVESPIHSPVEHDEGHVSSRSQSYIDAAEDEILIVGDGMDGPTLVVQTKTTPVGEGEAMPPEAIAALSFCRVLLMPFINILMVVNFADDVLPESADKSIIKLILMIESATPSANFDIISDHRYPISPLCTIRRRTRATYCPCLPGADWCL